MMMSIVLDYVNPNDLMTIVPEGGGREKKKRKK
jgi:hypothetical protein